MPKRRFTPEQMLAKIEGSKSVIAVLSVTDSRLGAVKPKYADDQTFIPDPKDDRRQIPDPDNLKPTTDIGSRTRKRSYTLLVWNDDGTAETKTGIAFVINPQGKDDAGQPATEEVIPSDHLWKLIKPPKDERDEDETDDLNDRAIIDLKAAKQDIIVTSYDENSGIASGIQYTFTGGGDKTFSTQEVRIKLNGQRKAIVYSAV